MSFGRRKIPKHLIIEDEYSHSKNRSLSWIMLALIILVSSMAFSLGAKAETATQSNLTNYHKGSVLAKTSLGNYSELTHLHSAYQTHDKGIIKTMTLKQSFINNSQKIQKNALYLIPLPITIELRHFEITRTKLQAKTTSKSKSFRNRNNRINPTVDGSEFERRKTLTEKILDIHPGEIISITLRFDQREKVYF